MKKVLLLSMLMASITSVSAQSKYDLNDDNSINIGDVSALYQVILHGEPQEDADAITKFTVNGVTFEMVKVQGGTFMMGKNDVQSTAYPPHQVTLTTYSIGKTEVTQRLWLAVMGENPAYFANPDYLDRPVENVSWDDCQVFIEKLNKLTGKTFHLPTEAQWEFAARGGNKSKGYLYSGSDVLNAVAWHGNSSNSTNLVATLLPNELGLYDMSGNVQEWCQDYASNSYNTNVVVDPVGAQNGSYRIARGGGFNLYETYFFEVTNRGYASPEYDYYNIGLRLAM